MNKTFVPDGQRCEADDERGSDFGRCAEYASARIDTAHGVRHYVCAFHLEHWKGDSLATIAIDVQSVEGGEIDLPATPIDSSWKLYSGPAGPNDILYASTRMGPPGAKP